MRHYLVCTCTYVGTGNYRQMFQCIYAVQQELHVWSAGVRIFRARPLWPSIQHQIPGYTAVNGCMASDWHPRTKLLTKQGHRQYRARQLSWQSAGTLIRRSLVKIPLQSILCSTSKIIYKFTQSVSLVVYNDIWQY